MVDFTFPRADINIKDVPVPATSVDTTAQPLHVPFFFIQAEKGPINVPVEDVYDNLVKIFGSRTFDPTGPFWTHQNLFVMAASKAAKVTVIRLADQTAVPASLVVELTATKGQIPVYKTDASGDRVVDTTGAWVHDTNTDGSPKTAEGWTLSLGTRTLKSTESYDNLGKTVLATDAQQNPTSIKVPVIAQAGRYAGSAVNRDGQLLYSTRSVGVATSSSAVKSAWLRFAPIQFPYGNTVYSRISDTYGSTYNDVSLAATALNSITMQDMALSAILDANYVTSDGVNLLDADTAVYSDELSELLELVLTAGDTEASPFDVDFLTGISTAGTYYQFIAIDQTSVTAANLNSTLVPVMLSGGSDGSLGNTAFQDQLDAWIAGGGSLEFLDIFNHPLTHFYDSGFRMTTKYNMVSLLTLRDDIAGDWSTQDASAPLNTPSADTSAGASLMTRLQTNPESVIFGTDAMRASIYMQAGQLAIGSVYGKVVPTTYARLLKRVETDSGDHQVGTPKGRPNSEVKVFKTLNWSAATPLQKQTNWDACLNSLSSCARNVKFWSDIRTIYPDQTSLLSDDVMRDRLVYTKHIVRDVWTYFAGRDDAPSELWTQIETQIKNRITYAFNNSLNVTVTVGQTYLDEQRGYSTTVTVTILGNSPMRVWNVVVSVGRNATTTTSSGTTTTAR